MQMDAKLEFKSNYAHLSISCGYNMSRPAAPSCVSWNIWGQLGCLHVKKEAELFASAALVLAKLRR